MSISPKIILFHRNGRHFCELPVSNVVRNHSHNYCIGSDGRKVSLEWALNQLNFSKNYTIAKIKCNLICELHQKPVCFRCNFHAYCLFSMVNTLVYCIPAGWLWGKHGFLYKLGGKELNNTWIKNPIQIDFVYIWLFLSRMLARQGKQDSLKC